MSCHKIKEKGVKPMQNRIIKAADKFLVDNNTVPFIDHWSFRMGAKWMQNEMLNEAPTCEHNLAKNKTGICDHCGIYLLPNTKVFK